MVCQGEDDALLIRRERRPNLKGAALLGIPVTQEAAPASALLKGKKAALIVREDLVGDADGEEREALKKSLASMDLVVVADYALTQTAAFAHVFIPLAGWHEMEGTVVNFQGTVQKMARAVVPPRDRKAFYEVVSLWLKAAAVEAPDASFLAWHAEVKKAVKGMKDLSILDLLPQRRQTGGGPMTPLWAIVIEALVKILVIIAIVMTGVAYSTLAERKVSAWMQDRKGPNRVGPFGLLQSLADVIKFFFKEDITPAAAYRPIYLLAPLLTLTPALITFAVIPFGTSVTFAGRTFPLAIAPGSGRGHHLPPRHPSMGVYGIILAGWSSGNKYSLLSSCAPRARSFLTSWELACRC